MSSKTLFTLLKAFEYLQIEEDGAEMKGCRLDV
jgi:hypothetical protein